MQDAGLVSWVAVLAVSAGFSAFLILLLKPLLSRYFLAHPNARSAHSVPTPQGAGLAVMAALLIVCAASLSLGIGASPPSLVPVLAAAAFLTLLGAYDDAHAISVPLRLGAQALAALIVVTTLPEGFQLLPGLLPLAVERALLVIGIMWFVNAINFLDGLDWMMVAQVVPMTLGVVILQIFDVVPASIGLLALVLLGATFGFAAFNKHPAQIFLGDAGSLPIGLCLAYMLLFVAEAHLVTGLLLALYTLADSTLTLFRRAAAGEPIFSAHKTHFYQRAVDHGWRMPQVTTWIFLLGLLLMVLAVTAALARSLYFDMALLGAGVVATGVVFRMLTRGR
ncbi:MAG: glycosyl transferase [Alphaproteobacteria bacterium]|nr:glycosyl transferase [Alphaproteobacteria bacterium]